MNGLNCLHLNIEGLKSKIYELEYLLENKNIDIASLNETFLNDLTGFVPKFKKYDIIRRDKKDRPGGGVAIIVKKDIHHETINIKGNNETECVGVRLGSGNKHINFYSLYAPHGKPSTIILDKILNNDHHNKIICGDLNCKNKAWEKKLLSYITLPTQH